MRCKPWVAAGAELPFCMHIPRAANVAADFIVNQALDGQRDICVVRPCMGDPLQNGELKLVLYTDGGSRGNPGPSAAAACLCAVVDAGAASPFGIDGVPKFASTVLEGRPCDLHVVACIGIRLGIRMSNVAEYEAACAGRRLVVRWLRLSQFL